MELHRARPSADTTNAAAVPFIKVKARVVKDTAHSVKSNSPKEPQKNCAPSTLPKKVTAAGTAIVKRFAAVHVRKDALMEAMVTSRLENGKDHWPFILQEETIRGT